MTIVKIQYALYDIARKLVNTDSWPNTILARIKDRSSARIDGLIDIMDDLLSMGSLRSDVLKALAPSSGVSPIVASPSKYLNVNTSCCCYCHLHYLPLDHHSPSPDLSLNSPQQ